MNKYIALVGLMAVLLAVFALISIKDPDPFWFNFTVFWCYIAAAKSILAIIDGILLAQGNTKLLEKVMEQNADIVQFNKKLIDQAEEIIRKHNE